MSSRPRDVYSFKNNNSNNYLVDICCVRGIAYCDRHRTCAKGQRVERTWPAQGTGSSLFCLDGPPAWRVVWWETSQVVFPEKRTQRWRLASRLLLWERPQGQHLWRKGGGGVGLCPGRSWAVMLSLLGQPHRKLWIWGGQKLKNLFRTKKRNLLKTWKWTKRWVGYLSVAIMGSMAWNW